MARRYPVTFDEITITALQDIFEVYFGSNIFKAVKVLRQWFECSDTSLPTGTFLPLRSRILEATVTHGTGGGTPNYGQNDPGDTAHSFTAARNNTTKATTSGSSLITYEGGFYLYQGHEFMYDAPPIIIGGSGNSFVLELLAVPASFSVKFSGGLLVEEMG